MNLLRRSRHGPESLGWELTNQKVKLNIIPFPKAEVPELAEKIVLAHPFLKGLRPQYCRIFSQSAAFQYFDEGQEILHEGGEAENFYLIESGQVVLETFVPGRGMATIQTLGPGEPLGWSWLFPPHQWRFSAAAAERAELIVFKAGCLREHARQDRVFYCELIVRLAGVLAGRLEGVRTQLIDIYQMRP